MFDIRKASVNDFVLFVNLSIITLTHYWPKSHAFTSTKKTVPLKEWLLRSLSPQSGKFVCYSTDLVSHRGNCCHRSWTIIYLCQPEVCLCNTPSQSEPEILEVILSKNRRQRQNMKTAGLFWRDYKQQHRVCKRNICIMNFKLFLFEEVTKLNWM